MAKSANFLSGDLPRNSAIEQQQHERDVVRLGGARDFLRGNSCAERDAADAFGLKQQFENRETELVRVVRRRRQQHLTRIACRSARTRFTKQPLCEIREPQFLERLHLAAHDSLMHRFIQRNQRLLQKLSHSLRREQLRQMLLKIERAMRSEHPHRRFDFRRQRRGLLDRQAQHRLQRRVRERHHCAGAPSFRQQLFDQTQPRNLIGWVHSITKRVAERRWKTITPLPHVELLASQARDANDFTDMERRGSISIFRQHVHWRRAFASSRRRLDEDAHLCLPLRVVRQFERINRRAPVKTAPKNAG